MQINNIFADGTSCIESTPTLNFDHGVFHNVYADGTACIDTPTFNRDSCIPCELTEEEGEAVFHEYLSSIAPPVMAPRMLPSEFSETEGEAMLNEYLCDLAPIVVVKDGWQSSTSSIKDLTQAEVAEKLQGA